jgi:Ca2+-transporting ATPase
VVHNSVRGRVRFRVGGLAGSPQLKTFLESRIASESGVEGVRASHLTGNLLVRFAEPLSISTLQRRIEALICTEAITLDEARPEPKAPVPPPKDLSSEPVSPEAGFKEAIQAKIRRANTLRKVDDGPAWHTMAVSRICKRFDTDPENGLEPAQVRDRQSRLAPNQLPAAKARGTAEILWGQVNSLPVWLLTAAAGVSVLTGGLLDAAVVLGVVAANAWIGYLTESKAEKTIRSLKQFIDPRVRVIRGGEAIDIPAREVTVGDLVSLKPGTYVPADCRVIQAQHLSIDESMLTGESMPVVKTGDTLRNRNTPLADRTNMAYMGTLVTGGQGLGLVVAIGADTEIGRLQRLLEATETPETPIERQLRVMGDQLVVTFGVVCGAVFLVGLLRGYGFLVMLRTAISLAASAVPEGLPAAATINFALGIRRMREHRVLIRRLQAVETLGAVEVVCLDKTGTLTENRMVVSRIHTGMERIDLEVGSPESGRSLRSRLHPENRRAFLHCCILCNETQINGGDGGQPRFQGTATETALVRMAEWAGEDVIGVRRDFPMLEVHHRSENRLFMDTRHPSPGGGMLVYVKGSPMEVLSLCSAALIGGETVPLSDRMRDAIELENDDLAGHALRVLGLAFARFEDTPPDEVNGRLVWIGLVGMADPIRRGVEELIPVFHEAGIDTVMITGDQSPTAFAIADRLGISGARPLEILDSAELTAIEPDVLEAVAKHVFVYSRVSPAHKLRIVQAIQAGGKTVAMTGDGVNDGPALKAADLGIAMGRTGTDIAREVADVVLQEDNLDTLILAVKDGRGIYQNIRKSVRFFLATNFSEIMVMSAGISLGIGSPLNVMQLLWINIISDIFPGLSLSMEAPEPGVMGQPPRRAGAPLFSRDDYKSMLLSAAAISGASLGAYGFGLARYGPGGKAATLAFQSLTVGQLLHAYNCRREFGAGKEGPQLAPNPYLNAAIWGSLAMQGLTLFFPPLRRLLGLAPLTALDLGVAAGAALLPMALNPSVETGTRKTP